MIPTPLLDWLDLAGVAVFALTGVLAAGLPREEVWVGAALAGFALRAAASRWRLALPRYQGAEGPA